MAGFHAARRLASTAAVAAGASFYDCCTRRAKSERFARDKNGKMPAGGEPQKSARQAEALAGSE